MADSGRGAKKPSTVDDVVDRMKQRSDVPPSSSSPSAVVGIPPRPSPPPKIVVGSGQPHGALPGQHPRDAQAIFTSTEDHHAATKAALARALRDSHFTVATAEDTSAKLASQREQLEHTVETSERMAGTLRGSRLILRSMTWTVFREKGIKIGVLLGMLLIIYLICYFKWIRHSSSASTTPLTPSA